MAFPFGFTKPVEMDQFTNIRKGSEYFFARLVIDILEFNDTTDTERSLIAECF
ncbi:hypothetical protein D3C73_901860 [compost metagenome]